MKKHSRPILVTGATGFIGSWVVTKLIKASRHVAALDQNPNASRLKQVLQDEDFASIDFYSCDISNTRDVQKLINKIKPATIIHLAALQIPACRAHPVICGQVNVIGQINIFEAARDAGVKRIIYTSSAAAKPRGLANAPGNLYGVFKKTGEEVARIFNEENGLPSLGLRPSIVYGVGRDDGETSAITKAMRAAALDEDYIIPFKTIGCMEYISEVADIFFQASEANWDGAKVTDLTTKKSSVDDVLEAIYSCVPNARVTASDNIRVAPEIALDNSALIEIIGDWPRVSLKDGARLTIEHYRSLYGKV